MFRSVRGPDRRYMGNQRFSDFVKWAQIKLLVPKSGFLHHKVAPRPQKWPEFAKKKQKSPTKYHVLLCQGIRQLLHR